MRCSLSIVPRIQLGKGLEVAVSSRKRKNNVVPQQLEVCVEATVVVVMHRIMQVLTGSDEKSKRWMPSTLKGANAIILIFAME